jgi:hypothetical protein
MWEYILPAIVFLIISISMYTLSKDKNKDKTNVILIKNIAPATVVSVLVFVFIKYRDTFFNNEPMMSGNYFDVPVLST